MPTDSSTMRVPKSAQRATQLAVQCMATVDDILFAHNRCFRLDAFRCSVLSVCAGHMLVAALTGVSREGDADMLAVGQVEID